MDHVKLGCSGLIVPPFCFGGNVFGWTADENRSFAILDALLDAGLTFIDTANIYSRWVPGHGGGESEAIIGRWMAERGCRDRIVIATGRLIRDLSPTIGNGGAIVMILAISAKEASPILPISNGLRPGLAMLTKSFAEELGPRAIRVNALLPNLFATDRMKQVLGDREPPVENIALKRMGEPAELGRMATVLLSPVSSYVTGTALSIDGGQLKSL